MEDPVLEGCPTDVDIFVQSMDLTAALYWQEPTATDNSGQVDLTSSHELGERRGVGTINVQYTASDAASRVDSCTFPVSVELKEGNMNVEIRWDSLWEGWGKEGRGEKSLWCTLENKDSLQL